MTDPVMGQLLRALELSGMRALDCDACGREFLTRGEGYHCPPCRGEASPDVLTFLALAWSRACLIELLELRQAALERSSARQL